ncbi:MAG: hypothetical protein QM653_17305 [Dysgonomonas sp.]|uniref:hypothetical protein n=1 Tax=Dysgonomonas sp. TaxID=1891233 RepID=UPI0039E496B3
MKRNVHLYILIFLCVFIIDPIYGQTGINTSTPQATLDVEAVASANYIAGMQAPRLTLAELTSKGNTLYGSNHNGIIIYITDTSGGNNSGQRLNIASAGYYYFDGNFWQKFGVGKSLSYPIGSIKESFKKSDHNGWFLMDGRTISALPTAAQASLKQLGFNDAVPDARDKVLKTKSTTEILGSIGGSNSFTIKQENLPNIYLSGNLVGTTSGNGGHSHTFSFNTYSASHTHTFSSSSTTSSHSHGFSKASGSAGAHTHTFSATSSTDGNHNHAFTMPKDTKSSHIGAYTSNNDLTFQNERNTDAAGAHTHAFSGNSNSGGTSHSHSLSSVSVGTGGGAHTHSVSGYSDSGGSSHTHGSISGSSGSGGSSHRHTFSGNVSFNLGEGKVLDNRSAYTVVNTFIYLGE